MPFQGNGCKVQPTQSFQCLSKAMVANCNPHHHSRAFPRQWLQSATHTIYEMPFQGNGGKVQPKHFQDIIQMPCTGESSAIPPAMTLQCKCVLLSLDLPLIIPNMSYDCILSSYMHHLALYIYMHFYGCAILCLSLSLGCALLLLSMHGTLGKRGSNHKLMRT